MGWIRLVIRLLALIPWTSAIYVLRLAALPVTWVAPRLERRIRAALLRVWGKGAGAIGGMRVEVRGVPPKPPYILVCNHLTYLDAVCLGGVLGGVFVAKSEVRSWPVIGLLAASVQVIFIDRERIRDTVRVNSLISDALEKGYGVQIFAEAGVSKDCTVNRFKPALLEPAVRIGYPVHYATLSYRTPDGVAPAREVVAWLEGVTFTQHLLRLLRLPKYYASITFGPEPIRGDDRKVLADALCEAVRAQFTPLN